MKQFSILFVWKARNSGKSWFFRLKVPNVSYPFECFLAYYSIYSFVNQLCRGVKQSVLMEIANKVDPKFVYPSGGAMISVRGG